MLKPIPRLAVSSLVILAVTAGAALAYVLPPPPTGGNAATKGAAAAAASAIDGTSAGNLAKKGSVTFTVPVAKLHKGQSEVVTYTIVKNGKTIVLGTGTVDPKTGAVTVVFTSAGKAALKAANGTKLPITVTAAVENKKGKPIPGKSSSTTVKTTK
jgi:hypothetical protein